MDGSTANAKMVAGAINTIAGAIDRWEPERQVVVAGVAELRDAIERLRVSLTTCPVHGLRRW